MFTIYNFEEHISATIIKRGKDYYDTGCVTKVKETVSGNWEALVKGTEKYEVIVQLKDAMTVSSYDCDCLYDGATCKHVVALLFYLKDKLTLDITPKKEPVKKKPAAKKFSFESLLESITLKEYKDFIGHYATSDKDFKAKFELYFSHKDEKFDIGKTYGALIKKLARKYTAHGFMDYRSCKAFANEIHLMIKTAYDYFTKDNYRDALALAKVLIQEITKPTEYCDDSSGSLGDAISNTIDLLDEMITHTAVPFPVKEQIVVFLAEELNNSLYFDYGNYGYEMTHVFFKAAKWTAMQDVFIAYTDKKIHDYKHVDYDREFFITQKIEFLNATGRLNEAVALASQNMEIEGVRALEVKKLTGLGDYANAKKLVIEGISIAEQKKHGGTVRTWQKELYAIATLENDIATMRDLAKFLAFDWHFDFDYYKYWKETYSKEEWTRVIEAFIDGKIKAVTEAYNKEKHSYYRAPLHIKLLENLSDIYIQEKHTDRILQFIKTGYNLHLLEKYHDVLLPEYATELLNLYPTALANQCEGANSRSDYKGLANVMKKIVRTIPESKEQIAQVIQTLVKKYPRRPAMIEELSKV